MRHTSLTGALGIMGAGQLGRMMGLAAADLGIECRFVDTLSLAPASRIGRVTPAEWTDHHALRAWAAGLDRITWEFENIPLAAVEALGKSVQVLPHPRALEVSQDRLLEKQFLASHGMATAPFRPIATAEEIADAVADLGFPAIVKTRRLGYDGRGQVLVASPSDLAMALTHFRAAEATSGGCIVEGWVEFRRELSAIAVRSASGEIRHYPLVENCHRDGILRETRAPAPHADRVRETAETWIERALTALNYVGVLALELFDTSEGLVANEMAPRVHNSGHWTIDGAVTSQFENHVRAVMDLPLGDTSARGHSLMINLIGAVPAVDGLLTIPGAHLHLYDKAPRPGRKLGHLTICGSDPEGVATLARQVPR